MAQLAEIIYDEQILPAIIKVIDEATKYVVLVSPFNKYPPRLLQAFDRAANRPGVSVVAVCRKGQDQGQRDNAKDERASRDKLRMIGAEIYLVENLHAKIYYNESFGIVTSMNLLDYSDRNSMEVGFKITDEATLKEIRKYVEERLLGKLPSLPTEIYPMRPSCISCNEEIKYDTSRPRCLRCHNRWDGNTNRPEIYCHGCGKKRKASYGRPISFNMPLCRSCHKEAASAKRGALACETIDYPSTQ